LSLKEFEPYINQKMLFSLNWRYGGSKNWEKKGISLKELQEKLNYWLTKSDGENLLKPSAVYGIFRCKRDNNEVVIFQDGNNKELGRFVFDDVIGKGNKDIINAADYFRDDKMDIIGLQLTTSGHDADEIINNLKNNDQESAFSLQGLSDRIAEDLADYTNNKLNELLFGKEDAASCRYSPGYPAITEMSGNKLIFDLLKAKEKLKIRITSAHEFVPTGSTGAVVSFHPKASYN